MPEHPIEQQRRDDETTGEFRSRMGDGGGWRGEERRNGWTIWKEIYGTAIGILPFAVAFFVWVTGIDKQGMANSLEIAHLRESRGEVLVVLSRISDQIAALQQSVARLNK